MGGGCSITIDGGTTHTRVWAVRGETVLAHARAEVGARDTARDGSNARLRAALRELLVRVLAGCPETPTAVVAAGMITSPQGLCEVPHVEAPAGARELAAAARIERLADLSEAPILFVPGVRAGPAFCDADTVLGADVMRGEEVLALGLGARGHLPRGGTLLNLGSHWKAIQIDGHGRVAGSTSTLSGELIAATVGHTILASALPQAWPDTLDGDWTRAGESACAASGLPRALYCVRLLEQRSASTPEQRFAFLVGAVMQADIVPLVRSAGPVVVVGAPAVAGAWARRLGSDGIDVILAGEQEVEAAFRAGCRLVLEARGAQV